MSEMSEGTQPPWADVYDGLTADDHSVHAVFARDGVAVEDVILRLSVEHSDCRRSEIPVAPGWIFYESLNTVKAVFRGEGNGGYYVPVIRWFDPAYIDGSGGVKYSAYWQSLCGDCVFCGGEVGEGSACTQCGAS